MLEGGVEIYVVRDRDRETESYALNWLDGTDYSIIEMICDEEIAHPLPEDGHALVTQAHEGVEILAAENTGVDTEVEPQIGELGEIKDELVNPGDHVTLIGAAAEGDSKWQMVDSKAILWVEVDIVGHNQPILAKGSAPGPKLSRIDEADYDRGLSRGE